MAAFDVLLIEGDPVLVDVLTEFLSDEGLSVKPAANGALGLIELVKQSAKPRLIIFDPAASLADSIGFCAKLSTQPFVEIPVIFTGCETRAGLVAHKNYEFLPKPFAIQAFLSAVRRRIGPRPAPACR